MNKINEMNRDNALGVTLKYSCGCKEHACHKKGCSEIGKFIDKCASCDVRHTVDNCKKHNGQMPPVKNFVRQIPFC